MKKTVDRIQTLKIRSLLLLAALPSLLFFPGCAVKDREHRIVVSVPEQRMAVYAKGTLVATYPVSTSKFGVGSKPGSYATPLGRLEVARKIGANAPEGAVFKNRKPTGEVLPPNAPGRDPIVTRILWLTGREPQNRNAYNRHIYIHGTPEELNIGKPASFGCIRMRSADVIQLFNTVGVGAEVMILPIPISGN